MSTQKTLTETDIRQIARVASAIITSQEGTYGSVNRNDSRHGMSIGLFQWNAYWGRAMVLLKRIVKEIPDQAKKILGAKLYDEVAKHGEDYWNHKERAATEVEAAAISKLLTTDAGKRMQDAMAREDVTTYIRHGIRNGLVSKRGLAYYADLENQGGAAASKRIAEAAAKSTGCTIAEIGVGRMHAAALEDSVMGMYKTRRNRVFAAIQESELAAKEPAAKAPKKDAAVKAPKKDAAKKPAGTSAKTGAGVTAADILAVAKAEVGYLEKASNAKLDSKTDNAGYNNYTKYARDLQNWVGAPYCNGVAWCDMFFDWCMVQACVARCKDRKKGLADAKKMLGGWSAYTPASAQFYMKKKQWGSEPKVGAQIFFKNDTRICHTGIVYKVDSKNVYTYEGNTSSKSGVVANGGGVSAKSYPRSYPKIAGYGYPEYAAK